MSAVQPRRMSWGSHVESSLWVQCLHTYQPICGAGMMKPAHRDTIGKQLVAILVELE